MRLLRSTSLTSLAFLVLTILGCSTAYAQETPPVQNVQYEGGLQGEDPYIRISWTITADLAGGIALELRDENGRTRFYDSYCWNCYLMWIWSSSPERYKRYSDDRFHLKQAGCEMGESHVVLTADCLDRFDKPAWSWGLEFPDGFLAAGMEYEVRLMYQLYTPGQPGEGDRYTDFTSVTIPELPPPPTATPRVYPTPIPSEGICHQLPTWREAVKCLEERMGNGSQ